MNFNDIKTYLLKLTEILSVTIEQNSQYLNTNYTCVFKCSVQIQDLIIGLVICVPKHWKIELISIFIEDYEHLKYIPHVEKNGKMCLFKTEGILIEHNLLGIIIQSTLQALEILKDGYNEKNKIDFIHEFNSYYIPTTSKKHLCYFITKNCSENSLLKFTIDTQNTNLIYIGNSQAEFRQWNIANATLKNAAYFVINNKDFIYPPDIRKNISIDYLKMLFNHIPVGILQRVLNKVRTTKLIVFKIVQPDTTEVLMAFHFNGDINFSDNNIILNNIRNFKTLNINKFDKDFLRLRTQTESFNTSEKKLLVIGCGSIGGYLINELAKFGFEKLSIVDHDILKEHNIFRHILGLQDINQYKTTALKNMIEKNIPETRIITFNDCIESCITNNEIDLSDYDLIISTTGNHNINRWLNSHAHRNKVQTPIIYAWNEVMGIGHHVAIIKYGNKGCYECFFDKNNILFDRTSYCKADQGIIETIGGCNDTFIPYGNTVSIRTVITCLDLVHSYFEGNITKNCIISTKGDTNYFISHGYELSSVYENQKQSSVTVTGNDFFRENCSECCYDN